MLASLSGGKNIVANLRDGDAFDLSVKFTGVQPFAFSYRRILSSSEKGNVFVESKQISGIEAQEYHFPLDAAGTYELISVSDKFCRYPPE